MNKLTFTVPGVPVPKARARITKRGSYTPAKSAEYERKVAILAKKAMLEQGFKMTDQAVKILIDFTLPRPQYHYKTSKGKTIDSVKEQYKFALHTVKPDIDNLIKSVKDALNKVVWNDDSQVIQIEAYKDYGVNPECEIKVEIIDD